MIAAIADVVEKFSPERRKTDSMEEPSLPALSIEQGARKDAEDIFIRERREQHDLTSKHSSDYGSVLVELPDVDKHSSSGVSSTNGSDGTIIVLANAAYEMHNVWRLVIAKVLPMRTVLRMRSWR